MKSTLLAIDSYRGISDFLPFMWEHFERAGCDIVGVDRTNAPTRWPKPVPTIAYGEDVFKRWSQHKSHTLLNDRWLGTIETLLADERFKDYTDFCLSTWSVLFTKPLPEHPGGIVLHRTGGPMPGFQAPYFFHCPYWLDRTTGTALAKKGRELMAAGENEQGSTDVLFGLMIHRLGIEWVEVPAYSRNRLDSPEYMEQARASLRGGIDLWIHGIKNVEQLNALLA